MSYDLNQHLPYRIAVVSNLLQLARDIEIRSLTSLGSRELRVLLNIGCYQPISAAQVAAQTKLDSYTISRGVKTLLKEGYLIKESIAGNKKEKQLSLTEEGNALHEQLIDRLENRDHEFKEKLGAKSIEEINQTLLKLEQHALTLLAEHALQQDTANLPADQKEIIRWYKKESNNF